MASGSKKPRVEMKSQQLNEPTCLSRQKITELARVLDSLCFDIRPDAVTVTPLKILNSNAADKCSGIPFLKAYCSVAGSNKKFMFGEIFRRGLIILKEFLVERKVPENKQERYVLNKLLHFIETDDSVSFDDLEELNKTELTTLFANHLFGKLSASPDYIIDSNCDQKKEENDCLCGTSGCKLTGCYGDTSIGNGEVWHGNVAIIIQDMGIQMFEDKPDLKGKSPEAKSTDLSRNSCIIAETIVFSFLQKKRQPEKNHFLMPCIGVGCSDLVVMFYDSESDVLLESSKIELLSSTLSGSTPVNISLTAVVVAWLAVNYKYLFSGLTEDMKSTKADFFQHAKSKIEVYENDLVFQNVGRSVTAEEDVITVATKSDFSFNLHQELSSFIHIIGNTSSDDKV